MSYDDLVEHLRTHAEIADEQGKRLAAADWRAAADRIEHLEAALRNVAAACNQLEGYERLPRERQVELVRAIRRFTGVKPQMLRDAEVQP